MDRVGEKNAGVEFLLENMASSQFHQTLLGFNTVIRMGYSERDEDRTLTVSFESDDFSGWMEATEGGLESKLGERFGDDLTNVSDRGFDLTIACPDGITDEHKTLCSTLRDFVYCETFRHIIEENCPQLRKGYKYTEGKPIQVNRKCRLYIGKTQKDNTLVGTYVFDEPRNPMERELLYVFLSEFQQVKRKREFNGAPSVSFRKDVDGGFPVIEFGFQARHQADLPMVCRMLYSVPDDLEYHIKASKTFFHHNMHTQVKSWLQELNNADPTKADGKTKKSRARRSLR